MTALLGYGPNVCAQHGGARLPDAPGRCDRYWTAGDGRTCRWEA